MDTIEPWFLRNLSKPPEISRFYEREDLNLAIKEINNNVDEALSYNTPHTPEIFLQNLQSILLKLSRNINENIKYLKLENTALFSFVYQTGRHRNEKFMQVIKKIIKCMKNWEELNINNLIKNNLQVFPSQVEYIKRVRLPTTKSMRFLLSRILGSYYLMMRMSSYCLQAACYLRLKLSTGHFFATVTIFYSFVARVRTLSLDLASTLATSYDEMLPYIDSLLKVCETVQIPAFPTHLVHDFKQELAKGANIDEKPKPNTLTKRSIVQIKEDSKVFGDGVECKSEDLKECHNSFMKDSVTETTSAPKKKRKRKKVSSKNNDLPNLNEDLGASEKTEIFPNNTKGGIETETVALNNDLEMAASLFPAQTTKDNEDLGELVSEENLASIKSKLLRNISKSSDKNFSKFISKEIIGKNSERTNLKRTKNTDLNRGKKSKKT